MPKSIATAKPGDQYIRLDAHDPEYNELAMFISSPKENDGWLTWKALINGQVVSDYTRKEYRFTCYKLL